MKQFYEFAAGPDKNEHVSILHFAPHLLMHQSAQRTDTLAHICSAGTQKVAHRIVQAKHGHLRDYGFSSINNFSDPLPKWARSPLGKSKDTPCGTCSSKVNSAVGCLKLMGASSCLRLSFSAAHFLRQ